MHPICRHFTLRLCLTLFFLAFSLLSVPLFADDTLPDPVPADQGGRYVEDVEKEEKEQRAKELRKKAANITAWTGGGLGAGVLLQRLGRTVWDRFGHRAYSYRGKPYENSCHSFYRFLSHSKVRPSKLPKDAQVTFPEGWEDKPVLRPNYWQYGPILGLLAIGAFALGGGTDWLIEINEKAEAKKEIEEALAKMTPEEREHQELLEKFYEPEYQPQTITEDHIRKSLQDGKLQQLIADRYSPTRARGVIYDIFHSPDWKNAIADLALAKDSKELRKIFEGHRARLDWLLAKYAKPGEERVTAEDFLEATGVLPAHSANDWYTALNASNADFFSKQIVDPDFFKDEMELPWDRFSSFKNAFLAARGDILATIAQRKTDKPKENVTPTENPVTYREIDRKYIKTDLIREAQGIDRVRSKTPEPTLSLVDLMFGHRHADLADKLLIQMAERTIYPPLELPFDENNDRYRIQQRHQTTLLKLRSQFQADSPSRPFPRPDIEELIQWSAAHLILFELLSEAPDAEPQLKEALSSLEEKLGLKPEEAGGN